MQKIIILLFTIITSLSIRAQSGLYIQGGTLFIVRSSTTFSVDSLVLYPTTDFSVNSPNSLVRNTYLTHSSFYASIKRVYKWSNTTPAYTGPIRIYYQLSELNGLLPNRLTLNIHNGSNWAAFPIGVTRDAANQFVHTTAVNNTLLNELTLANASTPLPLTWGPVHAQRSRTGISVQWITLQEQDVKELVIHRSLDGIHWTEAGSASATNTSIEHSYSFLDQFPYTGMIYYRILEKDNNGKETYSPTATVASVNESQNIIVWPNPIQDRLTIQSSGSRIIHVTLFQADGKEVFRKEINASSATINVNTLPSGIYQLAIQLKNQFFYRQIIKQ